MDYGCRIQTTSAAVREWAGGGADASAETAPREKVRRRISAEPPYKVVLHNDNHNSMEHVVISLCKVVPRMDPKKAERIMLEAHFKGKAVVIKCHKELAELYQEGLISEGLTTTIEPD